MHNKLLELGFTDEEVRLFSTPMFKLSAQDRIKAVSVSEEINKRLILHEKETYVRPQRKRTAYGISDHITDDGSNIWHPNANGHIGSKSKFRAETKARGGVEVGNELEGVALSDEYALTTDKYDKQIITNQIDRVFAQVERGDLNLVGGLHE